LAKSKLTKKAGEDIPATKPFLGFWWKFLAILVDADMFLLIIVVVFVITILNLFKSLFVISFASKLNNYRRYVFLDSVSLIRNAQKRLQKYTR